jgi:hypothetical protein
MVGRHISADSDMGFNSGREVRQWWLKKEVRLTELIAAQRKPLSVFVARLEIVDGVAILIRQAFGSKKKRTVGASIGFAARHGFWRIRRRAGAWMSRGSGLVDVCDAPSA